MLPSYGVFGRTALISFAVLLIVGWGGNILEAYGYIGPDGLAGWLKWLALILLFGALFVFAVSVVPLGARTVFRQFAATNQRAGAPAWAQGLSANPTGRPTSSRSSSGSSGRWAPASRSRR